MFYHLLNVANFSYFFSIFPPLIYTCVCVCVLAHEGAHALEGGRARSRLCVCV